MRNLIILCLSLTTCCSTLFAQQWKNYTSGLAIRCIAQEIDTMWIGTEGGLSKMLIDGTNLAVYTHAEGLPTNIVSDLAVDTQGNKWIASDSGLTKFDGMNFTIFKVNNSPILSNKVNAVTIDSNQNVWVGTSLGLMKYDGVNWMVYDIVPAQTSDSYISNAVIDKDNNLWVTAGVANWKFDGVIWHSVPITGKILAADKSGNIWSTKITYGYPPTPSSVAKYDGINSTIYSESNSPLPFGGVVDIAVDENNHKWFYTNNSLLEFDNSDWLQHLAPTGFGPTSASCIIIDASNNKWFGSIGNGGTGVFKFDGTNWDVYNPSNSSFARNFIYDVSVDRHGNKWFVSNETSSFDDSSWISYPYYNEKIAISKSDIKWFGNASILKSHNGTDWRSESMPINTYSLGDIAADDFGNSWYIPYSNKGIIRFDGSISTSYNISNSGLASNWCSAIATDENNIFVGTERGLSKYNGNTWYTYTVNNSGLPSHYFRKIAIAPNNDIWLATDKGLTHFNGNTWVTYDTANSNIPGNHIDDIDFDNSGNVWITPRNFQGVSYGAAMFNGTDWLIYNSSNSGLSVNTILNIAIDNEDNKWFATTNGVSELLSINQIPLVWLRANGDICSGENVTLKGIAKNMTEPYSYNWQSLSGNVISCNTCTNPTVSIQENTVIAVTITDNNGISKSDTLQLYACVTTGIFKEPITDFSSIYPNPATEKVNINLIIEEPTEVKLTLSTLDGRSALPVTNLSIHSTGSSIASFDVSTLANGIYILEIATNKAVNYRKLVVQH